jgi:glycogen(starch) synthase
MLDTYGENYFLIGPYFPEKAKLHFRPITELDNSPVSETITHIRNLGFEVHYGYWLLEDARPRVLLINPFIGTEKINQVKARLWQNHGISTIKPNQMVDQVIGFGEVVRLFLEKLIEDIDIQQDVLAHYHEWMSATSLPELTKNRVRIATVFTTHATVLGRYLTANEAHYFSNLTSFNWLLKSREYDIEAEVAFERAAAKNAHVLVTNSELTARECEVFLSRKPDSVVRNGINKKPGTGHEAYEEHQQHRSKIDTFVKSFFTPSYQIKTEKTLYFFTSGRYEYQNKGFNVTLEALARLNDRLIRAKSDLTIVMFVISKQPFHNIRPDVLESKKRFQDLNKICQQISGKIGPRIYSNVIGTGNHKLPDLNQLVDQELLAMWKQALVNFKRNELPPITTHHLEQDDEVIHFCKSLGLDNKENNRVKIVYHPDFIERTKSLFGLDYLEFVRGCNLGIFPSLYEPWGHVAMETVLQGTPAITSDTSGFSQFLTTNMPEHEEYDLRIINRMFQSEPEAIHQLSEMLFHFTETFKKAKFVARTSLPKRVMDSLCWTELQVRYRENYKLAFVRHQPTANLY